MSFPQGMDLRGINREKAKDIHEQKSKKKEHKNYYTTAQFNDSLNLFLLASTPQSHVLDEGDLLTEGVKS